MDNGDSASLPADLADLVQSQMVPGERIVWCGQPLVGRLVLRAVPPALFFAIGATLTFGWILAAMLGGLLYGFGLVSGHGANGAMVMFLPVAGLVLGTLLVLRARLRARDTAYVITNRRAMIVSLRPTLKIAAYEPADLWESRVVRRRGAAGDIILADGPAAWRHGPTWNRMIGVENVDHVKRLLSDLLAANSGNAWGAGILPARDKGGGLPAQEAGGTPAPHG
jgi:hypothetical protein